jgi:hypothetical protein
MFELNNFDKLKQMDIHDFAQRIVFDSEGNMLSPCSICAFSGDCNDKCYSGVLEWLKSE